ncbi:MAG: lysoplasmalogenase [Verrucomicrobia bacterium]|jgi:hypothetical protein|nr:lysoplasmalogenase [Verrucomicrobiota bacterium]
MTTDSHSRPADPAARVRLAATLLCVVAVAGMVGEWLQLYRGLLRQLIGAASTCYLLIALAGRTTRPRYQGWMVTALGFCWLGDMLGPRHFLTGVVMFFLAHVGLIGAFIAGGIQRRNLRVSLAVIALLGGAAAWLIVPHVPIAQRPFILVYSVALIAMLGVAGGTIGVGAQRLIPIAALAFFVSDLCLAQTAFFRGSVAWTYSGYPLYYAACLLFAWSVSDRAAGSTA